MFNYERIKKAKELRKLYGLADAEAEEFSSVLLLLKELKVESIEKLIKKHPREAYINGIIHSYESGKIFTDVECNILASSYYINEIERVEELLEGIKTRDGDYEKTKLQLAGITEYCKKHMQGQHEVKNSPMLPMYCSFISNFIDKIEVGKYTVDITLKTELNICSNPDTTYLVRRQEIYEGK